MRKATVPNCPACGNRPLGCVELITASVSYDVLADGTLDEIGWNDDGGDFIKLMAECRCGYSWTIQKKRALALLSEKAKTTKD